MIGRLTCLFLGACLITSEVLDQLPEPGLRFGVGLVLMILAIVWGAEADDVRHWRRDQRKGD